MITKENKKKQSKLATNFDHIYRILISGGSESGKRNPLPNLMKQQKDDDYHIID